MSAVAAPRFTIFETNHCGQQLGKILNDHKATFTDSEVVKVADAIFKATPQGPSPSDYGESFRDREEYDFDVSCGTGRYAEIVSAAKLSQLMFKELPFESEDARTTFQELCFRSMKEEKQIEILNYIASSL